MATVQAELLRIGTKIAAEEPVIITEHLSKQMYVGWGNNVSFNPGLKIGAVYNKRGTDFSITNVASIFFEINDNDLGVSQMTVLPDVDMSDVYEGAYGELFLDAFTQYEDRPNTQIPAGLCGFTLGLTVVQARDLLVA